MRIRIGQKCAIKEYMVNNAVFLEDWLAVIGAEEWEDAPEKFLSGLFKIEEVGVIIPIKDFHPLIEECYGYNENNPHLVTIRSIDEEDKSFEIPLAWVRLF